MAVRDTVDNGDCDCNEKHDASTEHRDESMITEFPEHRDESKFKKVIKRTSRRIKIHGNQKTSRTSKRLKIRKSGHEDRDG